MAHPVMYDENDPWLGRLRELCARFPGCVEKVAHGRPTFRAGDKGKVFAYFGGGVKTAKGLPHERHEAGLLFLPEPGEEEALDQDERVWFPAYLGASGWRGIDLDTVGLDHADFWAEVAELLDASYRRVAPARLVAELDAP